MKVGLSNPVSSAIRSSTAFSELADPLEKFRREAADKGDYERFLSLHASEDYLSAFLEILPRLTDKDYWALLRQVWVMDDFWKLTFGSGQTNIGEHQEKLKELIASPRPCREHFLAANDASALRRMPEVIAIHRGYKLTSLADGFSWTTDIETAKFFANRFGAGSGFIVTGKCQTRDVIGYFTERSESEVVIHPKHVFEKSVALTAASP
ncbi:MAG: hypothetical protein ACXWC8_11570 [Limisphaerales bacterium]